MEHKSGCGMQIIKKNVRRVCGVGGEGRVVKVDMHCMLLFVFLVQVLHLHYYDCTSSEPITYYAVIKTLHLAETRLEALARSTSYQSHQVSFHFPLVLVLHLSLYNLSPHPSMMLQYSLRYHCHCDKMQ